QGERGDVACDGGPPDPPPPGHRLLGFEGPVVEPGGGGDLLAAAGTHRPDPPWAGDDLAGGCVAAGRGAGAGEQAHRAPPFAWRARQRRLRIRRRSRSEVPPQMPCFTCPASAYSRHSLVTGQVAQTALAAVTASLSPLGGKNRSGSAPTQAPSSI